MSCGLGSCISVVCLQDLLDSFLESGKIVTLLFDLGSGFRDSYVSTELRLVDFLDKRLLIVWPHVEPLLVTGVVLQVTVCLSEGDTLFLSFCAVLWVLCLGREVVVEPSLCVDRVAFLVTVPALYAVARAYGL